MKKQYSILELVMLMTFLVSSSLATAQDFKIQHIQDDIPRTGGTNTGFTAVSSLTSAFALPTNNRKTHAGSNGVTGPLEGDDVAGARVLTAPGTLTYHREINSRPIDMRFNTDIWEYIGAPGGANEFIVRNRYTATLNGSTAFVNINVSGDGITTPNNVIPIITGIMNNDTTNGADSGTGIAHLTSSTNLIVRKGTTSNNVTIYITLVEFTGSNWTVLHGTNTSTAPTGSIILYDGYDATGTATDVSSWNNSIIFTQSKAQTAASGGEKQKIRSQWPIMAPGGDNQTVNWTFHATRGTTANSNRHFIHILNNPDIAVTRFTDTSLTAGETTIDITSAGLTNMAESSIIGSFITGGNGTGYPQGYRNYYLNSPPTQAAHWCAKSGNSGVSHNIQIINFSTTTGIGPGNVTANLELWLKANKGVEEAIGDSAEHLDPVLNWLDNTINANDATKASVINRPIFNESAINFNPTIDFDGTNHELLAAISPNAIMTIFGVAEGTFGGATKHLLNLNGGGSGSVTLEQTSAVAAQGRYFDGATPSGIVSTVTTPIANGIPFLINYDYRAGFNSQLFNEGISQGIAATNLYTLPGTVIAGIGTHPTNAARRWNGGISEIVVYTGPVTTPERDKIESYLAIKYGITLGVNGTSQNYLASDGAIIWNQVANAGYNYNVTGIGQDNGSALLQKQSKSNKTTNDITIGIVDIASSNKANTNVYYTDNSFLMWGNNNGPTTAQPIITKDYGAGTGVATNASFTPIGRVWKLVVKDSVPTIKLSIPEAMVSSTMSSGGSYVMAIADDAAFTTNLTSTTMKDVGSDLEVDFYFEGTKYITFGYAQESINKSRSVSFDRSDKYLTAGDVNDLANKDYTISAWVKRNAGSGKFDIVSKRNYFNENRDIDPGPNSDGTYNHGYAFRINKVNQFRMVWRDPDDGTNQIMQTSATIPENEWHHICATFDTATNMAKLYIDGFLEDFDDTLNPMQVESDSHFMIGAAHHIKRQQIHDGHVDEVRVWDVTLSEDQIRYIMNQEIENNANLADGKVLPSATTKNEIILIPWSNLIAYYPMSTLVFGSIKDESNSGNDLSMVNYDGIDAQTAPLPYLSTQDGDWDTASTWKNGDVQYLPGVSSYLDINTTIDWNIVQIKNNITMSNTDVSLIPAAKNENRVLLGLTVNTSGDLQINGSTAGNTGNALTITHYLKLNGIIDLEGESQLIQTIDSDIDVTSSGKLERDQQGTADMYTYNYWSSPVGRSNITSNNNSYTLSNILRDDALNINFLTSGYDGTNTNPIGIADYWIWKFANQLDDDYSAWQHVRSTGSILAGEGYTMKGPGSGAVLDDQNYVFLGKPNNGDINLTINAGNDYLVGNPYASAIDAHTFINDNAPTIQGNGPTTGTLYFWEHWGGGSHYLSDYQGGYATYNLSGGTPTAAMGTTDPDVGTGGSPTKTPGRYLPVGQGFFVIGEATGTIKFNNNQRVFRKENASSVFMSPNQSGDEAFTGRSAQQDNELGDDRLKIRLGFNSANTIRRQILLTVDEMATDAIDFGYDGKLYENQMDDMYWVVDDVKLIIQGRGLLEDETILLLGIHTNSEGINSIVLDNVDNAPDEFEIYLHDKELDLYHDLRISSYDIYLNSGEYLDRFEITFSNQDQLGLNENELKIFDVHYTNSIESIVIMNPKLSEIKSVNLFNILGQSVYNNNKIETKNYIKLEVKDLSAGTYIIKIKTTNNEIISKKVLIK